MRSRVGGFARLAIAALVLSVCGASCSSAEEERADGESVADTSGHLLSYEEFRAKYFVPDPSDPTRLIFDEDITATEEMARGLYESFDSGAPGRLAINTVNGADDRWSYQQSTAINYCISNDFGSKKNAVMSAIGQAAGNWKGAANVRFLYYPAGDTNCNPSNGYVVFDVRPEALGPYYAATAFYPSFSRANRSVRVDPTYLANATPESLAGVMTHEFGHALGFRHEHTRPEAGPGGSCLESSNWRGLTPYDSASVMHYPSLSDCHGSSPGYIMSPLDRQGAAAIYGPPMPPEEPEPFCPPCPAGFGCICGDGICRRIKLGCNF